MAIQPVTLNTNAVLPVRSDSAQKQGSGPAAPQAKTDTVAISQQAKQLAAEQYSQTEESKETTTKKLTESSQGKK